MDIGSIIMGVILLAACTLPFIITTMGRKKKEKLILNQLKELAGRSGLTLGEYDIWSKSGIAMSEGGEKLFFVRQLETKRKEVSISMDKVKDCRLVKEERVVSNHNENYKVIEKLILHFSHVTNKDSDLDLELYNAGTNVQIGDELALAQKWEKKVQRK